MLQQSFKNDKATLFLVPTPIGNLQEMTPRSIQVLKDVSVIAAEDTRTFGKLKAYFQIETPLVSYHMHNEQESTQNLLRFLAEGKDVALVSDAGYPLISDPGQTVVFEVVKAGYNVVPISGSSAFLNALVASGLVVQPFAFMGFVEAKEQQMRKQFQKYKTLDMTTVYYLSVHKLEKVLRILYDELGNRDICLAREITKQHETFIRGTVSEVMESVDALKGEFVLVIAQEKEPDHLSVAQLLELVEHEIQKGQTVSRAIARIAKQEGISKNELYAQYHEHESKESV